MTRRWQLPLVLLALAAAAAALVVALTRSTAYVPPAAAADAGPTVVRNATLHPGEISLAVRNSSEEPVRIAQVAVNDGYVEFQGGRVAAGATARVVIPYPWIDGESYEFELLTTDGDAITYELEDAGAA